MHAAHTTLRWRVTGDWWRVTDESRGRVGGWLSMRGGIERRTEGDNKLDVFAPVLFKYTCTS